MVMTELRQRENRTCPIYQGRCPVPLNRRDRATCGNALAAATTEQAATVMLIRHDRRDLRKRAHNDSMRRSDGGLDSSQPWDNRIGSIDKATSGPGATSRARCGPAVSARLRLIGALAVENVEQCVLTVCCTLDEQGGVRGCGAQGALQLSRGRDVDGAVRLDVVPLGDRRRGVSEEDRGRVGAD